MSASARRTIWFIAVPLLLVAGLVVLVVWGVRSFLAPSPSNEDAPPPLASVSLPNRPNSITWSADGNYLAAGTWGLATGETGPGEVIVVDVAKATVLTTLQAKSWVGGLAFSPDGKWLAVATRPSSPAGAAPAELVVFDVPAFTARFTAKAGQAENGFIDLAWAADSKSLSVIDGPVDNAQGESDLRRWDVPAFTEQPVIHALQLKGDAALAVSPDGRTLALAQATASNKTLLRLFDLDNKGAEKPFLVNDNFLPPRLGFTADGKALGVFDTHGLSWWDVGTGRPAQPAVARFAAQPAGLTRCSEAVSLDGNWQARGYERHRGLGDLGWDNREKEFGTFIKVTRGATAKTWTWRVSAAQLEVPAVSFSPDGKKLAASVWQPIGGSIEVWALPK